MKFIKEQYYSDVYGTRFIMEAEQSSVNYDFIINAIIECIQPNKISDDEITSWTVSCVFEKDNTEVYFEEFYDSEYSIFSFELFPFREYTQEKLCLLENWLLQISKYIQYSKYVQPNLLE